MRALTAILGSVLILASACCDPGDDCGPVIGDPDPGVSAIRIGDGDSQVGPAGQALPDVVLVQIYETGTGTGVSGERIRFAVESGGGRLAIAPGSDNPVFDGSDQALRVTTDASGDAGVVWYLGSNPGENTLKAEWSRKSTFVRYTATGHGAPAHVAIDRGDGQTGDVNAELAERVAVKITDAGGIQIPGMRVWFIPQNGGLPLDGEVITSSRSGVAQMASRWQLGPAAGPQTLIATVLAGSTGGAPASLNGNPVTFTATARAPSAHSVAKNPSNFPEPQAGTAGQPVAVKPSVKVLDAAGQALAGVSVRYVITAGGGNFGGNVTTHESITDAGGILTVPDWILGAPGTNTVTATVQAQNVTGNPVLFTANAAALALAITAGNNQSGPINATLQVAPQVRVTGAGGAGIAGIRISWSLVQGAGSFLPLAGDTDANGYATLDYFGPTAVGPIQLRASTTDPRVSPQFVVFTLTGVAAHAP